MTAGLFRQHPYPSAVKHLKGGGVCGTRECRPGPGGDIALSGQGKWYGLVIERTPVAVLATRQR